jgi:hypothetical protein
LGLGKVLSGSINEKLNHANSRPDSFGADFFYWIGNPLSIRHPPVHFETTAQVHFIEDAGGFSIPKIDLDTAVDVQGLDEVELVRVAESAKKNCLVSKLFQGAEISFQAHLLSALRKRG